MAFMVLGQGAGSAVTAAGPAHGADGHIDEHGHHEPPLPAGDRAAMALDMLDREDEMPPQASNGAAFQEGGPGKPGAAASMSGSGATDQLDTEDGSPGCVGDGTSGARSRWLYVVPSDRTSYFSTTTASGLTREEEMRDNIKFAERLMSYGSGPWREQQFRWYCSGTTPVITQVTITAVGSDNKITDGEIEAALEGTASNPGPWRDGDLHPTWLNLGPNDCYANNNGTCRTNPFVLGCAAGGIDGELIYGFGGAVLNGNETGTSTHKYTTVHETLHCLGAPDVYAKSSFYHRDSHEIMTTFRPTAGSYCQRVQLDCNKDEWYSTLEASGATAPQWEPWSHGMDGSNTAESVYLTPITSTSPTLYCAGTAAGTNTFDEADDTFTGGTGVNIIVLLDGDDWADTDGGTDKICGGDGDDYIHGQAEDDVLVGAGGKDELHGGTGNDTIYDGYGLDYVYGGAGTDTLVQCDDGAGETIPNNDIEVFQTGECKGRNFSTTAGSS